MIVKKATYLDGNLDVSGAVTMDNTLYVAETATIKKATSIEGILDVSGATLDSSLRVGKICYCNWLHFFRKQTQC